MTQQTKRARRRAKRRAYVIAHADDIDRTKAIHKAIRAQLQPRTKR